MNEAFRQAGWNVNLSVEGPGGLSVHRPGLSYAISFKAAADGRRDRVIPLLSQAVLEARELARSLTRENLHLPLAVIGVPRISDRVAAEAIEFARRYSPEVSIGLLDLEGIRIFEGPELESMNSARKTALRRTDIVDQSPPANLFSDLNQWMLKLLLAQRLPERYLFAPRRPYQNASQLAETAGVSVMSAFRLVRQLERDGFLEVSGGLKLVRIPALMERWQAANLKPVREAPMRLSQRASRQEFLESVRRYVMASGSAQRKQNLPAGRPRICVGLFAAAGLHGIGFVHGVPPHLYLERMESNALQELGLQPARFGEAPDVYVRIPWARESIFRAAVERRGVPVCDILQVWFDVSFHPARGDAQAREIRSRILSPVLETQE